jgi:hypothetical protein
MSVPRSAIARSLARPSGASPNLLGNFLGFKILNFANRIALLFHTSQNYFLPPRKAVVLRLSEQISDK